MAEVPKLLGGRYEVGDLLGRGGMAEVHLGYDTRLGRKVAIKMLRSDLARDQSFLARFRREAQSAAALSHAAIVAVFDHGEDHVIESGGAKVRVPYIVMEHVDGRTLRDIVGVDGVLAPAEALRVTEGVLDALAYSHRAGIVHRDIKPANVMVTTDGAVKVMDFGIARALADANATMTQTQAVIGTAQYLSPEQAQGQSVDERSDLYSTGCMLFELLTGRTPFVGDSAVSVAYQHVQENPPPPSRLIDGISEDLDAVVMHALAKPRDARYQDAAQFRADLQAVRLGRPISAAARGTAALAGVGMRTEALAAATTVAPATSTYPLARPAGPPPPTDDSPLTRSEMRPKRRRSPGATVALVVMALAAIGLLAYGAFTMLSPQDPPLLQVPGVVGNPQKTAEDRLTRAGFKVRATTDDNDQVPEGNVISQQPGANARLARGGVVTITVSTGPTSVTVPDLKGKSVEDARSLLAGLGLDLGDLEDVDDPTTKDGIIIDSNPGNGTAVAPGTKVNVRVGTGKVVVPNVVGKSQSEAQSLLADASLEVETEFRPTADVPEGQVLDQTPKGGEAADQGATVKIVVAQKPAPTATPTPTGTEPEPTASPPPP
jgi:eukaryotic-like serine/threonine-protein kinase